jgi:DNA-binding LytR/AlgR family response regulator
MQAKNTIQCLVVDDEPPALEILRTYIKALPDLSLVGECTNAVDAFFVLKHKKVDLLFLDIKMPTLLGTDFVRSLGSPPKVIFTTAYRKFAVEGFELNAIDYLLKPISFERFLKAMNKIMDVTLANYNSSPVPGNLGALYQAAFICFRSDRKMHKVALDDIIYVESSKDYIKVVTTSKTIVTKQSISSLEENLPKSMFLRIHRSFIVAINKIQSYSSEMVMIGKDELPVSRMYKHEVDNVLR